MPNTFQVAAHLDALAEDEHGVPYLVVVSDSGRPGLVGHLRVLLLEEDGVNLLRIVWAQLTSEDEDAAVHETLDNGAWWHRALDAVLEEVIFNSPAVDHAVDEDGGVLQYAWVGGEIQEATLYPAADEAKTGAANGGTGPASMEWARQVFEPEADLTAEQLERFFDDIARMLAAKAFEAQDEDGDGGTGDGRAPEGGSR